MQVTPITPANMDEEVTIQANNAKEPTTLLSAEPPTHIKETFPPTVVRDHIYNYWWRAYNAANIAVTFFVTFASNLMIRGVSYIAN